MTEQEKTAQRGHRVFASVVCLLLLIGFCVGLLSLNRYMQDKASIEWHTWSGGELGREIDRSIDVPYSSAFQRMQAGLTYRVFGSLGMQVREGCPGWLFYADGLSPVAKFSGNGDDAILAARIAKLKTYAQALKDSGITLMVVTVPDKARVETQALCGLYQNEIMTRRLQEWQNALRALGVAQVDLLPSLQQASPAFFRTDVHWNASGAQAAATAIAPTLQSLLKGRGNQEFVVQTGAAQERVGDLLTLANLADVPNAWRPLPDQIVSETISVQRAGGLLDEVAPPEILLAGSSFSRRSHFAERLGMQVGRELWNVSVENGKFDRALQSAWEQRATWRGSVRVLIWEMSEDALSLPASE